MELDAIAAMAVAGTPKGRARPIPPWSPGRAALRLGDRSLLGLPVAAWAMVVAFLVGAAVLHYTPWGRQVLAIGGNVDAAKLMGLPVARTTFSVYVLSGALAGCAGVFLDSQNGSVDTAAGQGWELTAIAPSSSVAHC
jgi:ribose transport system permease protein